MSGVAGRKNEYVVSADGRKRFFTFFHHFFDRYEEVRYFQVHQRGQDGIEVHIVSERSVDEGRLSEKISKGLGEQLHREVTVSYVDAIPEVKSGKFSPIRRVD